MSFFSPGAEPDDLVLFPSSGIDDELRTLFYEILGVSVIIFFLVIRPN